MKRALTTAAAAATLAFTFAARAQHECVGGSNILMVSMPVTLAAEIGFGTYGLSAASQGRPPSMAVAAAEALTLGAAGALNGFIIAGCGGGLSSGTMAAYSVFFVGLPALLVAHSLWALATGRPPAAGDPPARFVAEPLLLRSPQNRAGAGVQFAARF